MSLGSLTDRLRAVVRPGPPAGAPAAGAAATPAAGALQGAPASPAPGSRGVHGLEAALGGTWTPHGHARCFVVERRWEPDAWHGRAQIGSLAADLERAAGDAPLLAGGAPAAAPFVFFDLETTGLSGGAGTYAFLVGMGGFDRDGAFVTRQYVMSCQADERPLLQAVGERLQAAGALVSFNGRSFDAPLLETRFLYHRLGWCGGRVPHVDVLHPARRFWRSEATAGELASCSLGTLERQVLGASRTGDVPGFEVPARYFQFVRSGDARPLSGVLEHNRVDLLSLAGLAARLLTLVRTGAAAARDAREALALGRLYDRAGLPGRAGEAYERALEATPGDRVAWCGKAVRLDALRALAHQARRARRYDEAAGRWRAILDTAGCPRPLAVEAAEALAIHHEHRVRDLAAAKAFALRTLDVGVLASRHTAVRHRLARLERKMEGAGVTARLELD